MRSDAPGPVQQVRLCERPRALSKFVTNYYYNAASQIYRAARAAFAACKIEKLHGFGMAKQAGAFLPDGLGRSARARGAGIPQAMRPSDVPDGRAPRDDSAESGFGGAAWPALFLRQVLGQADEICRHRFRLLGYEDLDFGFDPARGGENGNGNFAEIDWHLDPVNGRRSPLDPWF